MSLSFAAADRPLSGSHFDVLMAVEIRLFLAIDAFSRISGMVVAFELKLFLSLAKQILDSQCVAI
jgi:hypothetical protein